MYYLTEDYIKEELEAKITYENGEIKSFTYGGKKYKIGYDFELVDEDKEEIKVQCNSCYGEGKIDVLRCTVGSSSYCCGGCTEEEICEECDGTGYIIETVNYF